MYESAAAGHNLVPLVPKYLAQPGAANVDDESVMAIAANRQSPRSVLSVHEPLTLLREAAKRGELCLDPTDPAAAGLKTIGLCGGEYALDAPTGFLRQQGLALAALHEAGGARACSNLLPAPLSHLLPPSLTFARLVVAAPRS